MKANVYDKDRAQLDELGKSKPPKTKAPARRASANWMVVGLILLSVIPLAAGVFRLIQLTSGAEITPANARFFTSPLPVIVHILNASVYALMGAFQFATRFRNRRLGWHRIAGRVLVACGLLVGLSGLWMTLFYPWPPGDGELLYLFRLLFGSAMVVSIILGFTAIRRGDVIQHRSWMTRAYAIGLGAGTQAFTLMFGELIFGPPTELSSALLMGAGWVINLTIAEWSIRKQPANHGNVVVTVEQNNVEQTKLRT